MKTYEINFSNGQTILVAAKSKAVCKLVYPLATNIHIRYDINHKEIVSRLEA